MFEPYEWKTGDIITSEQLNRMEAGIDDIFRINGDVVMSGSGISITNIDADFSEIVDALTDGKKLELVGSIGEGIDKQSLVGKLISVEGDPVKKLNFLTSVYMGHDTQALFICEISEDKDIADKVDCYLSTYKLAKTATVDVVYNCTHDNNTYTITSATKYNEMTPLIAAGNHVRAVIDFGGGIIAVLNDYTYNSSVGSFQFTGVSMLDTATMQRVVITHSRTDTRVMNVTPVST